MRAQTSRVRIVCIATEHQLYLPYLKALVPDLIVLGMGTPWRSFATKYELLLAYLRGVQADELVCVIDAYDVLPTKHLHALATRFRWLRRRYPSTKMIIGHDVAENPLVEHISCTMLFGSVGGDRMNGGCFMGIARDLQSIIESLPEFTDDQKAFHKYANAHPFEILIDKKRLLFDVVNRPLQQCGVDSPSCFVHANMNGLLEELLSWEHGICVPMGVAVANYLTNLDNFARKARMYSTRYAFEMITERLVNHALL
jgi:hypothetical protein